MKLITNFDFFFNLFIKLLLNFCFFFDNFVLVARRTWLNALVNKLCHTSFFAISQLDFWYLANLIKKKDQVVFYMGLIMTHFLYPKILLRYCSVHKGHCRAIKCRLFSHVLHGRCDIKAAPSIYCHKEFFHPREKKYSLA